MRDNNEGMYRGGEGDDTCGHGLSRRSLICKKPLRVELERRSGDEIKKNILLILSRGTIVIRTHHILKNLYILFYLCSSVILPVAAAHQPRTKVLAIVIMGKIQGPVGECGRNSKDVAAAVSIRVL